MKIGDKVQVVDKPISLLKQHAGIKRKIIKKGYGNEWLIEFDCEKWWAKDYDLEEIVDDEK